MLKGFGKTWAVIGGAIGLVSIVALVVAVVQLRQSKLASDAQDLAQSTQIAILLQQLDVQQELATLQANSISFGPTSTQIAREIQALQSTAVVLATKQASIYPFSVDFKVEANKEWTDSNILISKDDIVSVKWLSGQWRTASTYDWENGFDCLPDPCGDCLSTKASEASLLIKVGNGSIQCAGNSQYTSSETGNLWLSFNDHSGSFFDNEGEIIVRIIVSHQ